MTPPGFVHDSDPDLQVRPADTAAPCAPSLTPRTHHAGRHAATRPPS